MRPNLSPIAISIVALMTSLIALSLVAWLISTRPAQEASQEVVSPALFLPPSDLQAIITRAAAGTATIYCGRGQGTGWILSSKARGQPATIANEEAMSTLPGNVITNHHVIKECIESSESIRVIAGGKRQEAQLFNWDEETDLALIAIEDELPALPLNVKPRPGWWSMTFGTPFGKPGSVAVGNVIHVYGSSVSTSSPVNPGNSGGPVLNALGEVMGTVTSSDSSPGAQNWNYVAGLPKLCRVILSCEMNQFGWAGASHGTTETS